MFVTFFLLRMLTTPPAKSLICLKNQNSQKLSLEGAVSCWVQRLMTRNQKTNLQKQQETGKITHDPCVLLCKKYYLVLNFYHACNCNLTRLEIRMIRLQIGMRDSRSHQLFQLFLKVKENLASIKPTMNFFRFGINSTLVY